MIATKTTAWRPNSKQRGSIKAAFGGPWYAAIKKEDWPLLKNFIIKHNIRKVVEFGCGASTLLLDELGVAVVSYETQRHFAERIKSGLKHAMLVVWNGQNIEIPMNCDLIFIDGPGSQREPAYRLASQSDTKYIACHDYQEAGLCKKWLSGWQPLVRGRNVIIYGM